MPPAEPLGAADVELLLALAAEFPAGDQFDEVCISLSAARSPHLLALVLRAVDPKVSINRRRISLSHQSSDAVARWIARVEGQPCVGLVLLRDVRGWAHIDEDHP